MKKVVFGFLTACGILSVVPANALPVHCATGDDDTCTVCESGYTLNNGACVVSEIKIATTKFVEGEFEPVETKLAAAIDIVDDVVENTIAQASDINDLQADKQTRPAVGCPDGKKCLLVKDANQNNKWYEIIDCDVVLPFTSLVGSGNNGQNFNGQQGKACTSGYYSNIEAPSVACQNNEWASVYENVVLYGTARAVNISESAGSIVRLPDNVQSGNVCVCNLGAYALVTTWNGRNSVFASRVSVSTDKWLVTGSLNGTTSTDCSTVCAFYTQDQARSAYVSSVANTCGTTVPLASL